jgi:hypothetical protein
MKISSFVEAVGSVLMVAFLVGHFVFEASHAERMFWLGAVGLAVAFLVLALVYFRCFHRRIPWYQNHRDGP